MRFLLHSVLPSTGTTRPMGSTIVSAPALAQTCRERTAPAGKALDQYTRALGLMYSTSSVSVYSWTGR